MNFYSMAGQMALGSRLRQLGERLMNDAEKIYQLYDVDLDPRWFPVFYTLVVKKKAGITEIAEDIGQSHPAVSQVVRSMTKRGIVTTEKCTDDARISRACLTPAGEDIAANLAVQCQDVNAAVEQLLQASGSRLWSELDAVEYEIDQQSLLRRVQTVRKARERDNVAIVDYRPEHQSAFKALNAAWIEQHWDLEPADYKALDHPGDNIIAPGGYIAMALYKNKVVGTCALMKMDDGSFELAKMAVADGVKGLGIGSLLMEHMIAKARELGSNRLYLESNTVLASAISLYRKFGFQRLPSKESPYQRCNIQMELVIG